MITPSEHSPRGAKVLGPEPYHALVTAPRVIDLGRVPYAEAYARQVEHHAAVLGARESGGEDPGRLLLVEHPPVITVSRRAGAAAHLLATPEMLARAGVEVAETDRGGDITYHGPGQLVVYPILDLSALNLGIHAYMRLLEDAVIGACARFGIEATRDPGATGVWTISGGLPRAKIAAMGVRVRRWVSMHGLALNVRTNLDHFNLIVPCGLHGRAVTSLERELGDACPELEAVAHAVTAELSARIVAARREASAARRPARGRPGPPEHDALAG